MMDFLKEFLKKIIDRVPLLLLLLGVVLLLAGATGGSSYFHVIIEEERWRIALGVVGVALMALGVSLALREPPPPIDCSAYEISITSPQDNESLNPPITITGRCKPLPKDVELWVFSISGAGAGAQYWPQASSEITDGTFRVRAIPGPSAKPGDRRKYGVFLVGPNGQVLVRYFKVAGNQMSAKGITAWPAITGLTNDIVQCGQGREITLK
jgi:hypothetical protein